MIDRKIIPDLEKLLAHLSRMDDALEAYAESLTDDVLDTQEEDEYSAWMFSVHEDIHSARFCLDKAIQALKQEA